MLLQTTFKKISILSRMQTQMWFHRSINKYQKTSYSSKYHPKETSFLHYTYPFFSKKMAKSTQFHPPFYSPFTFYWPCELWSSSQNYEPAEASPYEPEALPSIPQGTPEAPQHPAMLLFRRGLNHQSWRKHTNENKSTRAWKIAPKISWRVESEWLFCFQNRLRYWKKLRIHRGWARLQAGFKWPKLIPPLRGHNLESPKGQWFRDILPMKSCMASLKMMIIWAYDIFIMTYCSE